MVSSGSLPATQTHLAKLLDISQPSISDWNKPGGYPEMARVIEIATKFSVSVEWLATERGPMHVAAHDPLSESIWSLWKRLGQHQRAQLIGFATGLANAGARSSESIPILPHRTTRAAWSPVK